ncbi:MAG: endonuclease/exonuclease/phosphatase family protein [Bacteroidota bacterium]
MKKVFWLLLLVFVLFLLYLGGMIFYASSTDYEPEAIEIPELLGKGMNSPVADTLSFLNWNIGYCGLGKESDFFYDGGELVRTPEEWVNKNAKGVSDYLEKVDEDLDFVLLQEVDKESDRSANLDQLAMINEVLDGYVGAFGVNYKVGYIPIPLTEPMGSVLGGIGMWSKYQPLEVSRHAFEGNYDWPTYLFFLDRCFLEMRLPTSDGKELLVINTHNSAFDDGSLKAKQMAMLKEVIVKEYAAGNYVIIGGDWNQYPPHYLGVGEQGLRKDEQDEKLFVSPQFLTMDWTWAFDHRVATNRSLISAYDADTTRTGIIDYYLLSPNIELLEVEGIDMNFEYSDHQPVRMKIALKKAEEGELE